MNLNSVHSVTCTKDADAFAVNCNVTDAFGDTSDCDYVTRPGDDSPINLALQEFLATNPGFPKNPYVPPISGAYRIAKTAPWRRMTDEEAELITGAMRQANARQKAIYDAASYLSSDDPLWSTLHDMIAATLGSASRADELLAPEC